VTRIADPQLENTRLWKLVTDFLLNKVRLEDNQQHVVVPAPRTNAPGELALYNRLKTASLTGFPPNRFYKVGALIRTFASSRSSDVSSVKVVMGTDLPTQT